MSNKIHTILETLDLPAELRELVLPFVSGRRAPTIEEVVAFWRLVVRFQEIHPESSGQFATWAMSISTYCLAIERRKELLDIKYEFGYLEQFPVVDIEDIDDEAVLVWTALRAKVNAIA